MTLRDKIDQWIDDRGLEGVLMWDGLEEAFLGICTVYSKEPIALFDFARCIEICVDRDGMSLQEAREYLDYNVTCAWIGEQTPGFFERFDEKLDD